MALLEVDYLEKSRDNIGKAIDIVIYLTGTLPPGATDPTGVEWVVLCNNGDSGETQRDKCRDAVIALLETVYGFGVGTILHADIIVDDEANN